MIFGGAYHNGVISLYISMKHIRLSDFNGCDNPPYQDIKHVIPTGTVLYRSTIGYEKHTTLKYCADTGKYGRYFGTTQDVAKGMMFEYRVGMYQCRYLVTKSIEVFYGKYNYIHMNPGGFPLKNNLRIPFECQINHCDFEPHPVNDFTYSDESDGEVFISSVKDLKKLRLIDCRDCTSDVNRF